MWIRKIWKDYKGAALAGLTLLVAILLGIATILSLIDPLNIFIWIILGGITLFGLFWQAIAPQRELTAYKDNQAKVDKLKAYNGIQLRPYYFPWDQQARGLGVSGVKYPPIRNPIG